ncbi:hypothetical protein LOK49_LG01G00854 [Camellia lanceoleosa]|uniref:Uncharacterized protein n=1 Tax=Camellia lanceoleosa TaxID=1840588 RepID=A0ACC0J2Z5_9ERIC|nr:hypothetical protein LOK49_LG01G00854 [Camellia lanceoleosa]
MASFKQRNVAVYRKRAKQTESSQPQQLMMDFLAVGEELMPHRDFSNIGSCSQGKPAAANANDCQAPLQHLATVKNLSVVVGDSSGIGDASCEGFCDSTQYRP